MAQTRAARAFALCLTAAASFSFGIVGMEETFGRLRPQKSPPLLYSLELHGEDGALLASPLVVGDADRSVHLSLREPAQQEPEGAAARGLAMSLDLSPQTSGPNGICVAYRVSLEPGAEQRGSIALTLGERRSVRVLGQDGEALRLDLTVARAGSKAFFALLAARRKPLI